MSKVNPQSSSAHHASMDDAMTSDPNPHPVQHQPYPSYPNAYSAAPAYSTESNLPPVAHYNQSSNNTTTVIVQQPYQQMAPGPRYWSSRLCECGRDWSICCCGLFCNCCLESQVAQDMGESCLLPCCVPGWLITLRTKMRVQENIQGSVLDDCCNVCCCSSCALCQLAYEIKLVRERQSIEAQLRPV